MAPGTRKTITAVVTVVTLHVLPGPVGANWGAAAPPVPAVAVVADARSMPRSGLGAEVMQPIENRLSAGTTQLLRSLRKRARQVVRNLRYGAGRWSRWFGALVLYLAVGLVLPLLGRESWNTFREEGLRAFLSELSLAVAVYIRLLLDGRTPLVGKTLLAFALAYGASAVDLLPDRMSRLGFADDLLLLVLAARGFMRMCPQGVVEEHALAAAKAREENLRKKLRRRRRTAKAAGTSGSASAESS